MRGAGGDVFEGMKRYHRWRDRRALLVFGIFLACLCGLVSVWLVSEMFESGKDQRRLEQHEKQLYGKP